MTSRLEVPADLTKEQSAHGKTQTMMNATQSNTINVSVSDKSASDGPARQRQAIESDLYTKFVWGAGIECSFIPHLNVDQFEWTQHNRFWRDDFRLAKEVLGLGALRYAFPWHKIET